MTEATAPAASLPELLAAALARSPAERAGQLIFNALDAQGLARDADGTPRTDFFYLRDADLARALEAYARR